MGNFFTDLFGGGDSGSSFRGSTPGDVPLNPIQNPTDTNQANTAFANAINGLNMYSGLANGTGPNPALAQLNQATAQNVNNQAALMASQRGANANPGLIARQAAMQGNQAQQQAVGQAATLNAQQQVAGIQGYNQAAQGLQQNVLGSIGQQNQVNAGLQANLNNVNSGIAQGKMGAGESTIGGLLGGGGAAISTFLSHGGQVSAPQHLAMGGPASFVGQSLSGNNGAFQQLSAPVQSGGMNSGAQDLKNGLTSFGKSIGNLVKKGMNSDNTITNYSNIPSSQPLSLNTDTSMPNFSPDSSNSAMMTPIPSSSLSDASLSIPKSSGFSLNPDPSFSKGGLVDVMLSPGEKVLNPDGSEKRVPGKAKVKGDSLKNDKVPDKLEAGAIVIPRSVTQSSDPVGNTARFVHAILAKQGMRRK